MDRFEDLTAKYLDDVLSPAEGRELADHLRADPQARRRFVVFYMQDRVLVELCRSENLGAVESIMAEIRGEESAFVGSVMERVRGQGERRAVGFVTDGDPARPIYLVPELHELQYHVAPVVLDPDLAGKDLVVGRIDRPGSLAALCEQRGLAPVEDLGAGIVLLSSRGHAPPPFAGPPREREPR